MKHCRICSADSDAPSLEAQELMDGTRERHRYFRCPACTCLQIEEVPADLARYYGGAYYSFAPREGARWKRPLARLRDRQLVLGDRGLPGRMLAARLPTLVFDFLQPLRGWIQPQTRVLDVGCGAGNLLRRLRGAGLVHAMGVDPFVPSDVMDQGRVLVRKAQLDEIDEQFDLLTFHHSLEHMTDGLAVLRAARARLRPGGRCVVRVPLSDGEAWDVYGVHWVQLDAPRHLFLHTRQSLQWLAERAGFTCEQVVHDSTAFQFWGSEQYRAGIALFDARSYAVNPKGSSFEPGQIARWEARARELNASQRGDQAAFYLRMA